MVTAHCDPGELKESHLELLFIGSKIIDFHQVIFHFSQTRRRKYFLRVAQAQNLLDFDVLISPPLSHNSSTDVLSCQEILIVTIILK